MELGEEIRSGLFFYNTCSAKFKKERLLLNASHNLRYSDEGWEVRDEDGYMRGSDARSRAGEKRRLLFLIIFVLVEDLKPEEISGINSCFTEPGTLAATGLFIGGTNATFVGRLWCYNQEGNPSLGFCDEPMTPGQCNMVVKRLRDHLIESGLRNPYFLPIEGKAIYGV
ncbi:Profilin protein [Raphanus sativus]|nr:Profilin protein [Raphanus sativus]